MNINKNNWIVAEHLSAQQKEMLILRARVAGIKIPDVRYFPRIADFHKHSFIACYHNWNGGNLIGISEYPCEGYKHISYKRVMEKLRLIILNNNHLQNLKNESDN